MRDRVKNRKGVLLLAIIVSLLASVPVSGCAQSILLPDGLGAIEQEAFAGAASIETAVIPDGVAIIGDRAFSGCRSLRKIVIPSSVNVIGDDVFRDCAEDVLIVTDRGSAAQMYAGRNQIDYQAGTVYRALIIEQTYPDHPDYTLTGPANDASAVQEMLASFPDTPYRITHIQNSTARGMLSAIRSTFSDAGVQDVSLLYYSGHGIYAGKTSDKQGALLGADALSYVTAGQLKSVLDEIPGRKILILDSCYSGSMMSITNRAGTVNSGMTSDERTFLDSFISVFSAKSRNASDSGMYFILASAGRNEEAHEGPVDGRTMGFFTYHMTKGCMQQAGGGIPADVNRSGSITLSEVYRYTYPLLTEQAQHVQMFPGECTWFAFLRQ